MFTRKQKKQRSSSPRGRGIYVGEIFVGHILTIVGPGGRKSFQALTPDGIELGVFHSSEYAAGELLAAWLAGNER